jgi:hypothetical protein
MTNQPNQPSPIDNNLIESATDHTDIERKSDFTPLIIPDANRVYHQISETVLPINKTAIFEALERLNIAQVTVHFDGYGDSGQVESIVATTANAASVELSGVQITFLNPVWHEAEPVSTIMEIKEAIEEIAYDLLGQHMGGWQDNDGSFGDFQFDVSERTITLEIEERVTRTDYFEIVC